MVSTLLLLTVGDCFLSADICFGSFLVGVEGATSALAFLLISFFVGLACAASEEGPAEVCDVETFNDFARRARNCMGNGDDNDLAAETLLVGETLFGDFTPSFFTITFDGSDGGSDCWLLTAKGRGGGVATDGGSRRPGILLTKTLEGRDGGFRTRGGVPPLALLIVTLEGSDGGGSTPLLNTTLDGSDGARFPLRSAWLSCLEFTDVLLIDP